MSLYDQIISNTANIDKVGKIVVSLSGGLDSTTLLYLMVKKLGKDNVAALSFDYDQRHNIELFQAMKTCEKLRVYHKIINIGFLGEITSGVSAMVKNGIPVPTMDDLEASKCTPTYVPFRNSILSSITMAFAESINADGIALGVQYGDYENSESYHYWDCSKQFTDVMQALADLNDRHHITFIAPFVALTKKDEIKLGLELGVPYEDTWTCYNPTIVEENSENSNSNNINKSKSEVGPGPLEEHYFSFYFSYRYIPCGVCPACVTRAASFKALDIPDPLTPGVVYTTPICTSTSNSVNLPYYR